MLQNVLVSSPSKSGMENIKSLKKRSFIGKYIESHNTVLTIHTNMAV